MLGPNLVRSIWSYKCIFLPSFDKRYKNAAFCYEELIVSFPDNPHYPTRYAEILYSIGGPDNIKTARKYFGLAIKLKATHLRALYGLQAVRRRND